jgi:hypothetical protein
MLPKSSTPPLSRENRKDGPDRHSDSSIENPELGMDETGDEWWDGSQRAAELHRDQ